MSTESQSSRTPPSETVAGFLAVLSMAASGLAIFWDPFRASVLAVLLALIATGMAPKGARLPLVAVALSAIAFVVGMTLAVTTKHAIY